MNTARAAAAFMLMFNIIEEKKKPKRKVRWWMKELYRRRMQCGNRLMRDMTFEVVEDTVKNFTRMSLSDFEHITSFIEPRVKKMDTQFREAITVRERLAITLRFLATGDSYTSLQYLFRVSKQSISRIVPEVCDAIIEALKECIKVSQNKTSDFQISMYLFFKILARSNH